MYLEPAFRTYSIYAGIVPSLDSTRVAKLAKSISSHYEHPSEDCCCCYCHWWVVERESFTEP